MGIGTNGTHGLGRINLGIKIYISLEVPEFVFIPLTSLTSTYNTRWDTVSVYMSVAEYAIRKSTGRVNNPLKFWGCTNSPRYHEARFHTYINLPNKMDPDFY